LDKANITDIVFDEEDAKLLKLKTDLLLKAKGIRYSILPKLNVVIEEALSRIRKIYGVEVFNEGSIITSSPNFREKRDNELKVDYDSARIGLTGSRTPIWKGFSRKDCKPVKIICYSLNFDLTKYGIGVLFWATDDLALTDESFKKYLVFLKDNMSYLQTIQSLSRMNPSYYFFEKDENFIIPFGDYLDKLIKLKFYNMDFFRTLRFPIGQYELNEAIDSFVLFYPIYDSMIRIAKGEKPIFEKLVSMIKSSDIINDLDIKLDVKKEEKEISEKEMDIILSKKVDSSNTVRAGIRWQVFERDDFKCVACGLTALDGAILHIDHIIPRSKGGKDEMENYQTLCHKCNIGKSNKSQINLRNKL
jgi:hypothetical protein